MNLRDTLADVRAAAFDHGGEFDRIADPSHRPVLILGTGHLGLWSLQALRQAGIDVPAFCDNNQRLWGTTVEGLPVSEVSPTHGTGTVSAKPGHS